MTAESVSLSAIFSLRGGTLIVALIVSLVSIERDWSSVGIVLVSVLLSVFMASVSDGDEVVVSEVRGMALFCGEDFCVT